MKGAYFMRQLSEKNDNLLFWKSILKMTIIITVVPVCFGLLQKYFLQRHDSLDAYEGVVFWVAFSAGITFILTLSNSLIIQLFHEKMPWEKGRYGRRLLFLLAMISISAGIIMWLYTYSWHIMIPASFYTTENMFWNITLAVVISVVVTVIMEGAWLFSMWKDSLLKASRLREENLKSQLEVLNNQINPHFLFNTLNSIYVQMGQNPEAARESILQFSDLLSHQLYDSKETSIPLHKEIEYLKNYMMLEKTRQGDAVQLSYDFPENTSGIQVAPLLFMPIIENAFKFGLASGKEQYALNLSLKVDENQLAFTCSNDYVPQPKKRESGLGLSNLRSRLELLYPDAHTLDIRDDQEIFIVTLKLKLK